MTVIAWDGKTLAADKQSSDNWVKYGTTTKIRRIRGHLVGCAGDTALNKALMFWFDAGAAPADIPAQQLDPEKCSTMITITPDGRALVYQAGAHPIEFESRYYALGSGKDAAAAVMELGHDSIKAVEIASRICVGCGNGMDTLQLEA